MALADLMKRGFLTAATATPATVATDETKTGSSAATVATVAVANNNGVGIKPQSVATVATVAVANARGLPVADAAQDWRNNLILEFMQVDGLTRAEAEAVAAISVQPRMPDEWLALIAELDCLIERYCSDHRLTRDARMHVMAARTKQSLSSIPDAVTWFRRELMEFG